MEHLLIPVCRLFFKMSLMVLPARKQDESWQDDEHFSTAKNGIVYNVSKRSSVCVLQYTAA